MSRFEKVSFDIWKEDCKKCNISQIIEADENMLRSWYAEIALPRQATSSSAGCDFFMPCALTLDPRTTVRIPTGIRWICDADALAEPDGSKEDRGCDRDRVLLILPRSGLGFKYGIRLSNTVGVIDADYCDSDNEGHIIISLENPSDVQVELLAGKPFVQGIVVKYEIPQGAASTGMRNGGFGSTEV